MSFSNVQICVACVYGLGLRHHASVKQKYSFTWTHVKQCKDISLWRGCEEEGGGGNLKHFWWWDNQSDPLQTKP